MLKDFFQIDQPTSLHDVVEEMRKAMGLEREGTLPAMVDSLMKAIQGTPAEPTGVAAVPVAVTPGAASTRLGAKRNTRRPTPPATTRVTAGKRKQQTLFASRHAGREEDVYLGRRAAQAAHAAWLQAARGGSAYL